MKVFDSVLLQNLIRHSKKSIHEAPPKDVYVYRLFIEGDGDHRIDKLIENKP